MTKVKIKNLVAGVLLYALSLQCICVASDSGKQTSPAALVGAGQHVDKPVAGGAKAPWQVEIEASYAEMTNGTKAIEKVYNEAVLNSFMQKAENHLQKALLLAKTKGSLTDQADILYKIGNIQVSTKQYGQARKSFEDALSTYKRENPADRVQIADCWMSIATVKGLIGDEALKVTSLDDTKRAYDIYKKFLEPNDEKFLLPCSMLAEYASSPEEAIPYRKQEFEVSKKNYPGSPGLTGTYAFMISIDLGNAGRLDEAITQAEEAAEWCRKDGGGGGYVSFINENIEHWKRQKAGLEPAWDVVYNGKYAGRNARGKPENPNPPTVATAGSGGRRPEAEPETPGTEEAPPGPSEKPGDNKPKRILPNEPGHRYYVEGKQVSRNEYEALKLSNDASDLLHSHKFKEAEQKLISALELSPNLAYAHANLGLALSKLGQRDASIEHLRRAVNLAPDEASPLAMLASGYQANGQLDEAVTVYQEYIKKFAHEDDVFVVRALIKDLSEVRDRQKLVLSRHSNTELREHYLPFVTDHAKVRWVKQKIPIKIFVANGSGVHGYQRSFQKVLQDCFNDWVAETGALVSFEFVNSKKDADIDCLFTNNFNQVSSPAEGGEAQVSYQKEGNFNHCTIVLLTEHPTSTITPTDNEIRAVSLHEIGHTLGLMGHSPLPDDIMYCTVPDDTEYKRPQLSKRDLNTLKKLYVD